MLVHEATLSSFAESASAVAKSLPTDAWTNHFLMFLLGTEGDVAELVGVAGELTSGTRVSATARQELDGATCRRHVTACPPNTKYRFQEPASQP